MTLRERPWWLGLAVILMGAVCIYASTELAVTAQYAAIGPGLFVMGVGLGLVLLGVLLLIQIAQGEVFEPEEAENAATDQPMDKRAFVTALVAAILPALLIDTLGLPLTGMLSFMLVARAFGSRRLVFDLIVGLVLASLGWGMFGWLGLDLGGLLPWVGW